MLNIKKLVSITLLSSFTFSGVGVLTNNVNTAYCTEFRSRFQNTQQKEELIEVLIDGDPASHLDSVANNCKNFLKMAVNAIFSRCGALIFNEYVKKITLNISKKFKGVKVCSDPNDYGVIKIEINDEIANKRVDVPVFVELLMQGLLDEMTEGKINFGFKVGLAYYIANQGKVNMNVKPTKTDDVLCVGTKFESDIPRITKVNARIIANSIKKDEDFIANCIQNIQSFTDDEINSLMRDEDKGMDAYLIVVPTISGNDRYNCWQNWCAIN